MQGIEDCKITSSCVLFKIASPPVARNNRIICPINITISRSADV